MEESTHVFLLQVLNLLDSEAVDNIVADLSSVAASRGLLSSSSSSDIILALFKENIVSRLHVCLCLSPVGGALRRRIRLYPGLTKAFDIHYFGVWGSAALGDVASHLFAASDFHQLQGTSQPQPNQLPPQQQQKEKLSSLCVAMHHSAEEEAQKFLIQQSRTVYVTPKAFLDLISLFFIVNFGL